MVIWFLARPFTCASLPHIARTYVCLHGACILLHAHCTCTCFWCVSYPFDGSARLFMFQAGVTSTLHSASLTHWCSLHFVCHGPFSFTLIWVRPYGLGRIALSERFRLCHSSQGSFRRTYPFWTLSSSLLLPPLPYTFCHGGFCSLRRLGTLSSITRTRTDTRTLTYWTV
jgi:hypothetical protein